MGVFRLLHRIRGGCAGWHVGCEHVRLALGVPFGERAYDGTYCAHGDGAAAQQPYCEDWFSAAIPPVFSIVVFSWACLTWCLARSAYVVVDWNMLAHCIQDSPKVLNCWKSLRKR